MQTWVDLSTVLAAIAGLWALAFAWFVYIATVKDQNRQRLVAIKSLISGLRLELDAMRDWTGAGGDGYSKTLAPGSCPAEWREPGKIIWKFSYDAVKSISTSPLLYHLKPIREPFIHLHFSISKLFQYYELHWAFILRGPGVQPPEPDEVFRERVFQSNDHIHVRLIGGRDSSDPNCLYKTYAQALEALTEFEKHLKEEQLPRWYWFAHVISVLCLLSGIWLLYETIAQYLPTRT